MMLKKYYTQLFEKYWESLNDISNVLVNINREKSYNSFLKHDIPTKRYETYKTLDVENSLKPECILTLNESDEFNTDDLSKLNLIDLDYKNLFYVNQSYDKKNSYSNNKDYFVGSLSSFATQYPEVFKKYYNKLDEKNSTDFFSNFNSMFATNGVVLYVPKNINLSDKICLNNILFGKENKLIFRRLLVILEDNSSASIILNNQNFSDANFEIIQKSEIFIGDNSKFTAIVLDDNSEKVTQFTSNFVTNGANSNSEIFNLSLHGNKTRNNYFINLNGEEANAKVYGISIGFNHNNYVDNYVLINHNVPNCESSQLFRYILEDDSIGSFCGKIFVAKDAQKTMAYQSNNNLLLSDTSKMYSKPQLEIYADDVKCSHGMTTGKIDEDAIFYLKSRGIREKDARYMLLEAFANLTINTLVDLELRNYLFEKIGETLKETRHA